MESFAKHGNTLIRDEELKSDKSLPAKRKPELNSLDKDDIREETDDQNKKKKLGAPSTDTDKNNSLIPDVEDNEDMNVIENHSAQADKNKEQEVEKEEDEDEDEDEDEEDYEAEEEEDDDDSDDEHSNGNAEIVDPKGKGIMRDDKGKRKLIEESEDSSDCGSESDGDSDLSDDPLAEVDLDNILPSRTRRRAVRPGVYISNNQSPKGG